VGEEGLYELLAGANVAAMAGASFKTIVTTDPHSYNTIRNEYPDFGGKYQIQHYTSFVKHLFDDGKLRVAKRLAYRTTFHDPCHLGRFNKGYEAPRDVSNCWAANSWKWAEAVRIHFAAAPAAAGSGSPIRWVPRSRRKIASRRRPRFPILRSMS